MHLVVFFPFSGVALVSCAGCILGRRATRRSGKLRCLRPINGATSPRLPRDPSRPIIDSQSVSMQAHKSWATQSGEARLEGAGSSKRKEGQSICLGIHIPEANGFALRSAQLLGKKVPGERKASRAIFTTEKAGIGIHPAMHRRRIKPWYVSLFAYRRKEIPIERRAEGSAPHCGLLVSAHAGANSHHSLQRSRQSMPSLPDAQS